MCGICGIYNYLSEEPVDEKLTEAMTDMLAHRGPDGRGVYTDMKDRLSFGHRRLSIIDVEGGAQPMCNEDQSVWITYNGEIYNFADLKMGLVEKGHNFKTHSDTEVLVHLYEELGEDMLNELNGIFAFAVWDKKARRLLLARDHYGVKPLYFSDKNGTLMFASEIKSLLLSPKIKREIDLAALDMCLTFRHTPAPHTLLKDIKKLEPGSFIKIEKGKVFKKRYAAEVNYINRRKSEAEWKSELAGAYSAAVKAQMISDVPIGISLSGGVDSGTILSIMSDRGRRKVSAFTVGFELGDDVNEIAAAHDIANAFKADFASKVIKQSDYERLFKKYMWHLEEPIGNESALAYYFVAALAKDKVKVLLNGQGADEPFAGYPRHLGEKYSFLFRFLKPISGFTFADEKLSRMFYSLPERDARERLYRIYSIIPDSFKEDIYLPEMKKVARECEARKYVYDRVEALPAGYNALEKMLYLDTRTSLPDNLLLAEDKMSMACSIEARVPFLDRDVMDLAERIPADLKIRFKTQKYIHKRACETFLSKDRVYKRKIGFANPMDKWLAGSLGNVLEEYIEKKDSLSRNYFNTGNILQKIKKHKPDDDSFKKFLFLLLSIENWYRIFVLNEDVLQ
ncbi:MAG: asparagine synthase (glutamine-hydrolyzing) [Candidatus Omnitrophica bacterium]|nr:asparagine synthase (glutamine-hydrolyzing) [Candidatus Omnitrophota bacterium]